MIVDFLNRHKFAKDEITLGPIITNDLLANPYQNAAETGNRRFIPDADLRIADEG